MLNLAYLPRFQRLVQTCDAYLLRCQLDEMHTRLLHRSLQQLTRDFFRDKIIPALTFPALAWDVLGMPEHRDIDTLSAVHFLFYCFLDLTDDVEDQDLEGALWEQLGEAAAINTGTSLLFLSLTLLEELEASASVQLELHRQFTRAGFLLCAGQHRDLLSHRLPELEVEDALTTHLLKTGSSVGLYLISTATLARAPEEIKQAFYGLGQSLGVAAQIMGDWVDTREPWIPDFVNRCQSVPLLLLKEAASEADAQYLKALEYQAKTRAEAHEIYRYLLQKYEVADRLNAHLRQYKQHAREYLRVLNQAGYDTGVFADFLERYREVSP